MNIPGFRPAVRSSVKARIALAGPSGSGKTMTGLILATVLAEGKPLAVIDTEKGSASLYSDQYAFDVIELGPPFHPARYVAAIHEAERLGYGALLVDSLSHAWSDEGGVLDIVDKAAAKSGGNSFAGWKDGTPAQNSLINAIVQASLHVVVTMRSKTAYVVEQNAKGRQVPRKVGLEPIQRAGVEYEFALVGEMTLEHVLHVTKSRFRPLQDQVFPTPGPELGEAILAELGAGVEPRPADEGPRDPSPPVESTVPGSEGSTLAEGEGVSASPGTTVEPPGASPPGELDAPSMAVDSEGDGASTEGHAPTSDDMATVDLWRDAMKVCDVWTKNRVLGEFVKVFQPEHSVSVATLTGTDLRNLIEAKTAQEALA